MPGGGGRLATDANSDNAVQSIDTGVSPHAKHEMARSEEIQSVHLAEALHALQPSEVDVKLKFRPI